MWSNSLRREDERGGQQYQEYQQHPPPQHQAYPPPAPQYPDYPDDSSYPGGDGALASTINLVASGVSALFRAPPPRVPVQQHQPPHPPVNRHSFPPPLHPESSMLNSEPPSHVETFHQPAVQTYLPPAVQTFQQKPAAAFPQSHASPVMSPALQPAATTYMPPPVSSASPAPSPILQPAATTYTSPSDFFQAPAPAAQPAATTYLPPPVAAPSPLLPFSALQPAATTHAPPPVPFEAPAPALQPVATSYVPPVAAASPILSPTINAAAMPSPSISTSATSAPTPVHPIQSPALNAAATYVAPPVAAAYRTPSPAIQPLSNVAGTCLPPAKAPPVVPAGMSQPLPRTSLSRSTPPSSPRSTASSKFTASPKSTSSSKFKLPPLALPRPVHHPSPRTKKWGGFKVPPPITKKDVQSEVKKPPSSPSGKSVSSVPTGITFHSVTSAPSPIASPRLDTSFESMQNDETTRLSPPVFAVAGAPPQTNLPPQVEEWTEPPCTNMQAEESAPPSFVPTPTAPQMDAPVASVVAPPAYQADESPSPLYVAPPPAFVSPNESAPPCFFASANAPAAEETPRPPPPPSFVVTPGPSNVPVWAEETTRGPPPPPPAFVATPVTSAPPQFVAAPQSQVDESMSPLFSSSPPVPSQTEESAPPPPTFRVPASELQAPFVASQNVPPNDAVRAAAPPHVDSKSMYGPPLADDTALPVAVSALDAHGPAESLPPVNVPSFEGESPENEVPESDHNSTGDQLESAPERTATQEHVDEERFIEPPPEEERSEPLLPDGWTESTDPASGQTYYFNEEIGVSSWERPAAEELPRNEDEQNIELLPDGLTEVTEPASGEICSHIEEIGLSSCLRPTADEPALSQQIEEEEEAGDIVVDSLSEEEGFRSHPALPFGWIEQVDPSTGMSYFHNVESGVTTWERPFEEEPTSEERVAQVASDDSASAEVETLPDRRTEEIDGGSPYYYNDALEATDTTVDEDNTDEQVHVAGEKDRDKLESLEEMEQNKGETEPQIGDHEDVCGPLPAGWLEYIDRACGRPYYVNSTKNITSWERPQVPNSSPTGSEAGVDEGHVAEASPFAGIESPSPETGRRTGTDFLPESTSSIPGLKEQASETARTKHIDSGGMSSTNDLLASESGSEGAGDGDAEGKLPAESELYSEEAEKLGDEWDELVDPASGLTYYYNVADGTVTWDRPVAIQGSNETQNQANQVSEVEHLLSESDLSTADIGNPPESTSQHAEDADDDWNLVSSMDTPEVVTDPFLDDGNPEVQVEAATRTTDDNEETFGQQVDVPQLPPDWKEFIDPASGNPYFVNEVTSITTWERPVFSEATLEQPAGAPAENEQPVSEVNQVRTTVSPETDLDVSLETFDSETDKHAAHGEKMEEKNDASLPAEAPLPSGWAAMIDPSSGKTYYVNEAEDLSMWERPSAEFPTGPQEAAPCDEPPKGETQLFDEDGTDGSLSTRSTSQGDEYGPGNRSTDEMSSSSESEQTDDTDGQKFPPEPDETDTSTLPHGWIELIDVTSGRPYYVNEADNTTSWEKPVVDRPEPDTEVEPETSNLRSKDETKSAGETILGDEQDISSSVQREDEVVHDRDKLEDAAGRSVSVLPAGWIEEIDPASGNPYYIHEADSMTTWERPGSIPDRRAITEEVPPILPEETSASVLLRSDDTVDDYTMVEHSETVPRSEPPAKSASGELPDGGQTELPPGWVEMFDDASGSPYYMNEAENVSTWERPSSVPSKGGLSGKPKEDLEIEKQKSGPSRRERKNDLEDSPLPSGWAEAVDPGTGKTYYFHEVSNVTTWDRPNDAVTSVEIDRIGASAGVKERKPARVFATFGFGGKLCVWKSHAPSTVVVLRAGDLMKTDPVVLAEQKKKESNVIGPLNACEDAAVLNHIESKATDGTRNEASCHDLLWSLVLIAAKSNGRLRSDDGVRNAGSPEAGVISLLLDDTNGDNFDYQLGIPRADTSQQEVLKGEVADLSSLKNVEKLLLWGKREEAVQEAIRSKNFAMALLVASMCDRATFQEATKQFADDILSTGSPLHILAMLFSGQLQPPADSSLDRNGPKTHIWDNSAQQLHLTWRQHLAAIISNRTLGWDRIVLSLGDHLLDSGSIQAAHFCFVVCGCPVTSLLHPSSRISLVGCDHLVPLDAALMTLEGVSSYERTEAYEWAKRRGNPNAAIPSLQPFKLMYAMLLADMGFGKHAEMYVRSIRQCCGLGETTKSEIPHSISSTVWALSVRNGFEAALDEFEDRLSQGKLRGRGMPLFGSTISALITDASTASPPEAQSTADAAVDVNKHPALKVKVKPSRSKKVSPSPNSEAGIISEAVAFGKPVEHCEDVNATFLSAQSNLLDVTTSSKVEEVLTEPTKRSERRPSYVETVGGEAGERKIDSNATEKPKIELATPVPTIPGKGPMTVKPPPNSAPAFLGSSKPKSVDTSPQRAPSSDKKVSKWGLGIKDKMTKWLNPDATTADLGEGMQAYYDEKRKVWVFPGEDPEEKAKPIGPPPTATTAAESTEESPKAPMDPLAAMMAPPQRAPSFRRTSSILSQNEKGGSLVASRYPSMMPPGVAKSPGSVSSLSAAGPPPQFTVFKPVTKENKESTE